MSAVHGVALVTAFTLLVSKVIIVDNWPEPVLKKWSKKAEIIKSESNELGLVVHKSKTQPVFSGFFPKDECGRRPGKNGRKRMVGKCIVMISFAGIEVKGPAIK